VQSFPALFLGALRPLTGLHGSGFVLGTPLAWEKRKKRFAGKLLANIG
jgi:hypothetical protein